MSFIVKGIDFPEKCGDCPCCVEYDNECGKTKTLQKWLEHLYPNKSPQFLEEYFHGEPDSEIIKYIFENKGKRLEKVGK